VSHHRLLRASVRGAFILPGLFGSRLSSQSPHDANTAFVAAARAGAARYRSRDAAIADGFRPVGVEFPAMGEHWVNLARVMADTLDPSMPPVLIYVMINGTPQLGGVAFTNLLGRGESLGRVPDARFWHEHNGSITEESFPLQHHMGLSRTDAGDDLRLAILHVWTNLPNPAGPFATDNWTLPARRLALRDGALDATAARAAALAEDETGYYALMLETALHPSSAEHLAIDSVLKAARADARARVVALRSGKAQPRLGEAWESMWSELARRLPRRAADLRALRAEL
jgi:hypothetical protein